MFLGQQGKRKENNDSVMFEQKSNFYWEEYFFISLERKIIKKYFLSFVYFIYFLKKIFIFFYIFLFIYIVIYLFFDNIYINYFLFLLFFSIFMKIISYIINIIFFIFFFILNLLLGKFSHFNKGFNYYFIFFFKVVVNIYIYIYILLKFIIFDYIFFYSLKVFKKKIFVIYIFIQKNILKFCYFIYFLFNILLYIFFFIIFYLFIFYCLLFNLKPLIKYVYKLKLKNLIQIFFKTEKINFFQKIYLKLNIENILKIIFKYSIKFLLFLNFLFELLNFFNKPKIFIDRYTFFIWEEIRDEDYEYTYWQVNYKYIKYYADRKYFGLSGYLSWKFHILKYEFFIPFSYFLHKWEWQLELMEIQTFTLWEYTEIEKTFVVIYKYFSYYFLRENSNINRKNLFYDLYYFIWFFLIEDLLLYYCQLALILSYNIKWSYFIFTKLIHKVKNIYINIKLKIFNIYYKKYHDFLKLIKKIIINKYFYIYFNLLKIFILYYFLKFKKFIINFLKVYKFILLIKDYNNLIKFQLFIFLFFKKFLFFYFFNLQVNNNYYYSNLKKFYSIDNYLLRFDNSFKLQDILFKHYKNEQYYLFFKRFFLFKNMLNVLIILEEKKNLYNVLKTVLSYYKNIKSIDKLTWYDRLIGADAGYLRINKLYLNYLDIKRNQRKKKFIKFKVQKDNYYFYINNKK